MSDTPETDDLARGNHVVPTEWAEQLERERNYAKKELHRLTGKLGDMWEANMAIGRERDEAILQQDETSRSSKYAVDYIYEEKIRAERERDEALDTLTTIHRWIERQLPDGFIDSQTYSQNLDRVTDRWYERFDRLERERDKYKKAILECLEKNCHLADGEDCTLIGLKKALL